MYDQKVYLGRIREGLQVRGSAGYLGERFDVVGGCGRLGSGPSTGAGELEGHVHKLLPVCWGLIENAGKGKEPLICGPTPLHCDPQVLTRSTVHLSPSCCPCHC